MQTVTYNDMVARYGTAPAFDLLLTLENLARITTDIHAIDEETRFQKALEALHNINFAVEMDDKRRTN
jgi:hypothetical protein